MINVLSLFDGLSGARIALDKLGIPCKYYSAEIDKYAISVSRKNYPDIIQLGDLTKWREWDIDFGKIDLLVAGFSCQSWSMAGKMKGDNDPRGALVHDLIAIWQEITKQNPNVKFLFENVKMKKEFTEYINKLFGVEPILINSALLSAQNRKRNYWTNIPNVTQPEDKGITWGDVREHGVESESYYYTEKAMQWLGRHSRIKNKLLTVHKSDEKMQMIEASHHKKYSSQRFFGIVDLPNNTQTVGAMRGRYLVNGKRQDGNQLTKGLTKQYIEFRYDNKTNALTTVAKDNVVIPFTLPNRIPVDEFFFRYITPIECEKLQTIPKNYTDCVSNSQRYRMLGNSFTCDVIKHILSFANLDKP